MPNTNQREKRDREWLLVRRALIYLREPVEGEVNRSGIVPSIDQQRELCRQMAPELLAKITGEMTDLRRYVPYRPGLKKVLATARREERMDYLIVSSWDRLAETVDGALEIAWHLAFVGTVVVSCDVKHDFPWPGETPSS
jgi:DNA invertase Pin-like site-specific DNA recombinase